MPHAGRSRRPGIRSAQLIVMALTCAPAHAFAQTWGFAEQIRIGPPVHEFGSITDVALDAAGRLWIVDGMVGELFVADGAEARRVATPGEGPGELSPGAWTP